MTIAFFGAMLGVIFGIALGTVTRPEAWIIGLCAAVTGGMMVPVYLKPTMATSVVSGALTVYFVFHLNAGAIIAYQASEEVIRIIPYVVWFFPLVVFHQLTNFGFYKRWISCLVGLGPIPISVYVLGHLTDPVAIGVLDAIVTFLFSFFAFVLFVGVFTRHRDEEIQRAAMAEEANRTAAVLRVSEERFRLLGLATNDLVWDADLKSEKIWWSETLLDTYGYDPQGPATDLKTWETWIHPEERDRVVKSLQSVIESGGSKWTSEYQFVCADGRILDVIARGLVLRDETGEPVRLIGSTADVTELRELEKKLRQSQKMEAVGQLTGGIAHDFNNLLTIILGSAEALADIRAKDPKARELAETTLQAAERGAILTNRLLSFARRQVLAPRNLHPGQLLTGLEGLIRRTINADIEIRISAAADVLPIEADPDQLENAILNLVINARDAMPDGGHLIIEASNVTLTSEDLLHYKGMSGGRYVMVAVSDTGCGMPREIAERVFEPFFTTKEVGKGTGLGLSMVWGFVRQSNGHAQIYSEPDEGTTVKLYFPAVKQLETQPKTQKKPTGLVGGTEGILVVEDDDMVREHAAAQLASLGYRIKQAASAADAIAILDSDETIDLLFTDVVMPGGMNGKQLADAALLRHPDLKVLFTSGYTKDAIVHQGRLDPGANLLGKPYRRAHLVAKIRHVLDA
ncbi:MAG: ATP-binding protein [Roseovarius sp.]|uniref:hybrid sensor histidine kinase/response regulator n=1 Tax=Roseovarius sp. TaxID=1486281 RepID=UPI0032EB9400